MCSSDQESVVANHHKKFSLKPMLIYYNFIYELNFGFIDNIYRIKCTLFFFQ